METEKLYYLDPGLRTFTATVTACLPAGGDRAWQIVLDRTAFYPEGGGQPSDRGVLGGAAVTHAAERDGAVLHLCDAPLEVGSTVEGAIDWARRLDLTQQHSGEHIVSGLIHAKYGYDNVGFHLGSDVTTIDLSGALTPADLAEIEAAANRVIWENAETQITWPDAHALKHLAYRSKRELTGAVRIVTFPGADVCACCGTHVRRAGEIGLVKLLSCQKFREGSRVELLCGGRALNWLNTMAEQNHQISVLLSAKPDQTAGAARRLYDEAQALKARTAALQERLFAARAGELAGAGDVLLFEPGLSSDGVRRLCDAVLARCGGRCAVFSDGGGQSYQYAVGQADGDLRQLTKALNSALHGRGGGKPHFVQGSVSASRAEIEAFFREH